MQPDGRSRRSLGRSGDAPAWSADATKIAFSIPGEIRVADADGSRVRTVAKVRGASSPAWSPDSKFIAFGTRDIWVIGVDGGAARRVTPDTRFEFSPAWSPDGRLIAYSGGHHCRPRVRRCKYDVYVVHPDGSGRRRLTRTPYDALAPTWSPDGHRLAFVQVGRRGSAITVARADGTGVQRVTPFRRWMWSPVWSPDGNWIAYARNGNIWRMTPAGTHNVNLTRTPIWEGSPDWASAPVGSTASARQNTP